MVIYFTYGLLFACMAFPGILLGNLAFRCPSCTAEHLASCPKVTAECAEIVREPGCGCCPMCARLEGQFCGVYTPRCSSGLRCYPSTGAEFPLQQLIQGFGHCGQKVELDVSTSLDHQATNASEQQISQSPAENEEEEPEAMTAEGTEVHGTENPLTKRPAIDSWLWQESARKQHLNERKTKMKTNQPEDPRTPKMPQGVCEQELDHALEEISKMTSEDNRGPLENLYWLKFPNCERHGLYNLKQCNMSTHGQRGECWCVNPLTGVQIQASPKVRGDPNCDQFQEEFREMPTAATSL